MSERDDHGPAGPTGPEPRSRAVPQFVGVAESPAPVRHRHPKTLIVARILITFVSLAALVLTGTVWGYVRSTDASLNIVDALDRNSGDVRSPDDQFGDETFLVVGVDNRAGQNAQIGGTGWQHEGSRSDTIMLVNIPEDRHRVVIASFPRDLNITRPACDRWDNDTATYTDERVESEDNVKLNSAYYEGGPKCLIRTIQKITGMNITRFVGIDFAGFESMVDTLGGVEVCTTEPMWDDELGWILPEAGPQTVNGSTALDYVRARRVPTEGTNDYGRIKRQQLLLSSVLREALSNKVLFEPGRLGGFIDAFTQHTFVENVDTQSLLTLARSMQGVDAGQVTFVTIPTAGPNEFMNEVPREDDIDAIFDAIIYDWPLPGESAPEPDDEADDDLSDQAVRPAQNGDGGDRVASESEAVSPALVTIRVANGATTFGLASNTASVLAGYGFQIYSVGDHSRVVDQTVIRYSRGNEAEAATLASAFPGALLQRVTGLGNIVELVLGTDYDANVTAPATPGTPLPISSSGSVQPQRDLPEDLSVTNAGDTSCA
ncbi:LCP family protein [Hoyosella altamirensis]|uniref:LCP family protein required for cell wall assembly n=1 Tax=Hoyosella altamirensis TaxID=616997 RepID=A0A839RLR6_9ACTN|nr:LCP family protein [Hoyosella altamirensis]MBB3037337.1 LCP family protein required for cell wall assembly [Hoyosella altamirensis]